MDKKTGMLLLTRRVGERIRIGDHYLEVVGIRAPKHIWPEVIAQIKYKGRVHDIYTNAAGRLEDDVKVTIMPRSNRKTLTLGFEAPRSVVIVREEVEKR